MDLRQLREETRPEHEATEAAMPLMAPGLTLDTYKNVLRALLPILRSWESWAAEAAPAPLRPLLPPRRRSHLIEEDLRALRVMDSTRWSGESAPIDWDLVVMGEGGVSPTRSEFHAVFLGAFYVLEGSTLGGRMIARHLESVLGVQDGRGVAYFRGHGEETGAMWRETTAEIAAVPEEQAPVLIAAARRTFAAFGSVLGMSQAKNAPESISG